MVTIHIATEDELSEAVALKLVARVPGLEHGLLLRRGGNGYLRSRMPQWSDLARRQPVLVLTDLDTLTCPSALIGSWLGGRLPSTGLLLRVAVRTIEAWLLADKAAATALLGQRTSCARASAGFASGAASSAHPWMMACHCVLLFKP